VTTRVTAATSDLGLADLVLGLGSAHPSTHGPLRLALTLDGGVITAAEPLVGYLHRGAEKLFEVRDYRQIVVLANRHDWLSAFANELGVVLAVERMLGMEVPVRAVWARTLLAELNRVLSHLMFLGAFPREAGAATPMALALEARERLQEVMEAVSGGRMHYMFNRVGGLKEDLPAGWTAQARATTADVRGALTRLAAGLTGDPAVVAATTGVGVLSPDLVLGYGVSGPVARASGVGLDLRLDEPYLAYGELGAAGVLRRVVRAEGDCLARLCVLLDQVSVSLDVADACLDTLCALPPGPINLKLPKVVKAPEGQTYAWTESPLGINGYFLVSRGEKTPWRLKLRSASFNNVQVLRELLPGQHLDDLALILASVFFVVGDLDK
jgi:NADH-quinone oxidoreductase subunit D